MCTGIQSLNSHVIIKKIHVENVNFLNEFLYFERFIFDLCQTYKENLEYMVLKIK